MLNVASERRDQLTEQQQREFLSTRTNISANLATSFDGGNQEALTARIDYFRSVVPSTITQRSLVVHKDRGFFDTNDVSASSSGYLQRCLVRHCISLWG